MLELAEDFVEYKMLHVYCFYCKQLSPNARQAPTGTLQALLRTNFEPGTLVLPWVLGSSSNILQWRTLCFQGLRFRYSNSSSFVPEAPPKILAPKPLFQGFLVLYHGVKRLRFQVPPSTTICLLEPQSGQ